MPVASALVMGGGMPHNSATPPRRERMADEIEVGAQAPDFTLPAHTDTDVTLSSLRGKKVALLFYVFDFSPG